MGTLNKIGLDLDIAENQIKKLNELLANYQLFYMNSRGFHWNIKGSNFFELHTKFEELYNDSLIKIDEIAERILTLGAIPTHSYSEYLRTSTINEVKNVSDGNEAVEKVIEGLQALLLIERDILRMSSDSNDEGTGAMMSDYIREQEKLVWMYASYLNI